MTMLSAPAAIVFRRHPILTVGLTLGLCALASALGFGTGHSLAPVGRTVPERVTVPDEATAERLRRLAPRTVFEGGIEVRPVAPKPALEPNGDATDPGPPSHPVGAVIHLLDWPVEKPAPTTPLKPPPASPAGPSPLTPPEDDAVPMGRGLAPSGNHSPAEIALLKGNILTVLQSEHPPVPVTRTAHGYSLVIDRRPVVVEEKSGRGLVIESDDCSGGANCVLWLADKLGVRGR